MSASVLLRRTISALVFSAAATGSAVASAAVPATVTHQGRLYDASNNPINSTLSVKFTLYSDAAGTTSIWTETYMVAFDDGYFSVELGSMTPFDTTVFDGSTRYLGIAVGTDPQMTPLVPVASVPYAILAGDVNGDIHPTSVSVNGTTVINSSGQWVGSGSGLAGPTGATGAVGPQGAAGAAGTNGAVGPTGPAGAAGTNGAVGPTGPGGAAGTNGAVGPTGPGGAAGTNGAVGPTGAAGTNGAVGPTGPAGAAGTNGAVGPTGPAGTAGTNGAVGPTGPAGTAGTNGAVGPTGPAGAAGTNGAVGPTGAAGTNGAVGPTGPAGAAGTNGAVGPTGPAGAAGTNGAVGPTGPAGTDGTNGAVGPTGPAGADGAVGPTGADGAVGPTGPTDPTAFIQNQTATAQAASFDISGDATIGGNVTVGGRVAIGIYVNSCAPNTPTFDCPCNAGDFAVGGGGFAYQGGGNTLRESDPAPGNSSAWRTTCSVVNGAGSSFDNQCNGAYVVCLSHGQ